MRRRPTAEPEVEAEPEAAVEPEVEARSPQQRQTPRPRAASPRRARARAAPRRSPSPSWVSRTTCSVTRLTARSSRPTSRPTRPPDLIFLGLTGGIAAGKSTALGAFARAGCPVLSSDAVVHDAVPAARDPGRRGRASSATGCSAPTARSTAPRWGRSRSHDPALLAFLEAVAASARRRSRARRLPAGGRGDRCARRRAGDAAALRARRRRSLRSHRADHGARGCLAARATRARRSASRTRCRRTRSARSPTRST